MEIGEIDVPMRVLMVALDLNPPWVEGIRNAVRELSHSLIRGGHEVHCVTRGSPDQPSNEVVEGIWFHRVDVGEYRAHDEGAHAFFVRAPRRVRRVVREYGIDVIHGHSSYIILGTLIGLSAMGLNVGKVFSLYSSRQSLEGLGEYPLITRLELKSAKSATLCRFTAQLLDTIVVTTRRTESALLDLGIDGGKIERIPVGVDAVKFNPRTVRGLLREEFGIGAGEPVVLFAGDLSPWKGAEIFLEAIAKVRNKFENVRALLLTKGTYEYEDERLDKIENLIATLRLRDNVRILGRRRDIPHVYADSDVVVLPFSESSALMDVPRSLLEALACGRPVVATPIGGIAEVIEDGRSGLLVRPGDSEGLADSVATVLSDVEFAQKLGRCGRAVVEGRYDCDVVSSALCELYQKIVA